MDYAIQQKFISMNRSYKTLNAIGTVLHETADPGATDENEFNYFNTGNRGASAHAFVDCDSITQTVPWNEVSWHAGPTANNSYIGIELCHYDDAVRFQQVWDRAVWLFAWIHVNVIKKTVIDNSNLMSHAEVSQKWNETDHMDPVSYFQQFGRTVDDFRAAVQSKINEMTGAQTQAPQTQQVPQVKAWSTETLNIQKALNTLGIRDGSGAALDEDGVMGPKTTEAIKKFQSICGIAADGVVGPQSWNAINAILAKPTLSIGSSGIPVRYVQCRVGVAIDGSFGPRTRAAVAVFQRNYGLAADGVVGPATWRSLIG